MLDPSAAEVHDTASFYGFFRTKKTRSARPPVGVPTWRASSRRDELLKHDRDKLGVEPGGTTADGKITLEFAECIGGCDGAPCVLVNDEHRMNVTTEKADALVAELRQ